ncbi:MAG TPA: hypothetical protein P5572_13365 [Phycisphaerae bacterium]|nr:hypothetical protein [Phycisphaerales bacterium]HRX86002.1 hypothetical protein [Phycisphaerae bacterium]
MDWLDQARAFPLNWARGGSDGRQAVARTSSKRKDSPDGSAAHRLVLTAEHRMLLEIRDTLYEGRWDVFARDLEARRRAEPHVFDTVAETPDMLATIGAHLTLIAEMQAWERTHGTTLRSDGEAA